MPALAACPSGLIAVGQHAAWPGTEALNNIAGVTPALRESCVPKGIETIAPRASRMLRPCVCPRLGATQLWALCQNSRVRGWQHQRNAEIESE